MTETETRPLLHDAEETSKILGGAVSAYWLTRHAGRRDIPHTRIGRSAWWSDADIERLVAENYCDPRNYGRKARSRR